MTPFDYAKYALVAGALLSFFPLALAALCGWLGYDAAIDRSYPVLKTIRAVSAILVLIAIGIGVTEYNGPTQDKIAFIIGAPLMYFGGHQFLNGIIFAAYMLLIYPFV